MEGWDTTRPITKPNQIELPLFETETSKLVPGSVSLTGTNQMFPYLWQKKAEMLTSASGR